MLMSEWKLEDALVVEREEALEEGFAKGEEKKQHEIAAKALAEGLSLEIIQKITGLGIDEIITLS
jgi:predicted transposase YdaD